MIQTSGSFANARKVTKEPRSAIGDLDGIPCFVSNDLDENVLNECHIEGNVELGNEDLV